MGSQPDSVVTKSQKARDFLFFVMQYLEKDDNFP